LGMDKQLMVVPVLTVLLVRMIVLVSNLYA
jgi:hypothetical protein